MLGKKSRNQAPIGTLVGPDTHVHGDIEFAGGFHITVMLRQRPREARTSGPCSSISERGCVEDL